MSYKPNEEILVAYLYNELSAEERTKVEAYLNANPEAKKEVDEIKNMQHLMGKWQDKEVAEPTFMFDDRKVVLLSKEGWLSWTVRSAMAIAASIILLMIVGYFTNLNITKNEEGLHLSFGAPIERKVIEPTLTEENVKAWVQESVAANNHQLLNKIGEVEGNLSDELVSYQKENSKAIQSVKANQNNIDEALMQGYIAQLKDENKEILLNMMTASESVQRQYVNDILSDFSLYLEEQRQNDLEMIQTSFNSIKDNSEINQIETNQILASLITTVNNQNN